MLQATTPQATESDTLEESSLREKVHWAIGIARRQFPVIAAMVFLGISLGVAYVLTAPPIYTAEATILIDPRRVQLFQGATFAESSIDSLQAIESQIELVKSEPVTLSVVKRLRLADNPEFLRSENGFASVLATAFDYVYPRKPSEPPTEFEATRGALGLILKNLKVDRVGSSYNLTIKYRSTSPNLAEQVANAIAEAYISEQREGKNQASRQATGWLQGRIEELNQKRAAAERAVISFKQQKNMTSADGKLLNDQQLGELNTQLISANQKASEAKARLDRIDAVIREDSLDTKEGGTVSDILSNPIVTQLRTRYLDLVNREANWSRKYGVNHLAVVNLRNQIRDLRVSMLDELKRLRESYFSDYEIAKQRAQDLEKSFAGAVSLSQHGDQAQVALRELESSAQSYRTMHDNFVQRYSESLQQQAFPISDVRIIAPATRPMGKSGPKSLLILVIATAGGLALGVAIGTTRELMNGSLFTSTQVESLFRTSCISVVPSSKLVKRLPTRAAPLPVSTRSIDDVFGSQRAISRDPDVFWAVVDSPFSRFTEAIRSIKLAVDLNAGAVNASQVVGFTSSLPNEGKSTIATSLALLMAQAGARVILVDCDLRNPTLSRKLAPTADVGIMDVLCGAISVDDAIWRDKRSSLAFLPAFTKRRLQNSSELLASAATKALFTSLQRNYEYIVVDLSPLMPVVDVRATTGFVDSYICVVEWGRTTVDAVRHSLRDAHGIYRNLLGVVLNKANISRLSSYDPVGGNYYKNKYYAQYGLTE